MSSSDFFGDIEDALFDSSSDLPLPSGSLGDLLNGIALLPYEVAHTLRYIFDDFNS